MGEEWFGSLEGGCSKAATEREGAATSITLSAISASVDKAVPSGVEARTMWTLWCKNSSCRNDGSTPGRSIAASDEATVSASYHPTPHL